jgi:predicted dehydrogenase
MQTPNETNASIGLTRRDFVRSAAVTGAALSLSAPAWAQAAGDENQLNVALVGCGSQGRNLLLNTLKIPGIRIKAICDIWEYHRVYGTNILNSPAFKQDATAYESLDEMLEQEKDLDAVIIATPDWVHAEQTNACLKAGLHVYCEKEMSNTIEGAASMVRTARETGKLLQVGHQRRSNPRYHLALKLIENDRVCGTITHFNGQWNRRHRLELGWPDGREMSQAQLEKYGYGSMDEFRNWRWYRKYSGGPIADLGSHQIDIFSWFLKTHPTQVMASGGIDYYDEKGRNWYDNIMTIYEYQTQQNGKPQAVRGFYQVLNTTSFGDYYETLMGDEGTIVISEMADKGFYFKEPTSQVKRQWEDEASKVATMGREAIQLKVGESLSTEGGEEGKREEIMADLNKPVHQLHLENFFEAVRANDKDHLTCPPEVGYETAVTVLTANQSVERGEAIKFTPEMFKVS